MNAFELDGETLQCPNCKGDYLHQEDVVAYWRAGEDAETGLKVISSGCDRCEVQTSMYGNPSSRRDGITIRFSCESCTATLLLEIVQHKGQTFIRWRG